MNESESPPLSTTTDEKEDTSKAAALSECLFSQYALTVLGVTAGTGYALHKKPKGTSGLGIMLIAGAAGSLGDLVYGYTYACQPEVKSWQTSRLQQPQQDMANKNNDNNSRN